MDKYFFKKDLTLSRDVSRDVIRAEASIILFPLRKLRSTRITDLILTSAQRLSSSIPPPLHSGPQTLVAPEFIGIRFAHVLSPPGEPVRLPTQYPAVFALLTRQPDNEAPPGAGISTINKKVYTTSPTRNPEP